MKHMPINIEKEQIADFCRRHHIRKLALFGSVLGANFRPESDVDVLVEFKPGHVPGFIRLGRMERELSPLLSGRKLDLVTPKFLNHRIRDQILAEAQIQYVER